MNQYKSLKRKFTRKKKIKKYKQNSMYASLATFILIWALYYFVLKKTEPDITFTIIFSVIIIISQLSANSVTLFEKCQGSNFVDLAMITLLPWVFIFTLTLIGFSILPASMSEGLKSPFSNVIGYFMVVDSANVLLNDILVDPSVSKSLRENTTITMEEKTKFESTSQTILKLMGNNSILINEITPGNFEKYWQVLTPLMKDEISTNPQKAGEEKVKLLNIVYKRDSIGEAIWALYAGILCVAVSDHQLNLLKCSKTVDQMQKQYSEYLEEKKVLEKHL